LGVRRMAAGTDKITPLGRLDLKHPGVVIDTLFSFCLIFDPTQKIQHSIILVLA